METVQTKPHIPVLRAGQEYKSLDVVEVRSHRDGSVIAEVSQANAGMIRRDLKKIGERGRVLREMPIADILTACKDAARIFLEDTLPLNSEGDTQTPDEYAEALSATSGLPHPLCRANMQKNALVLREMPTILRGLMRGLDLSILDSGIAEQDGVKVWLTPVAQSLGAVLPSNSPGVHSLWIPSIALKVPLLLKPGREEPWTPMRLVQAMIQAGLPREAFSLYPTDHEGSATLLDGCSRSLLFGDERTTDKYRSNPNIEIHGPGWSKVILGADEVENWRDHLDVLVDSVALNGGRSCVNASSIFVPAHADEIAAALAERLAEIQPRPHGSDDARLAAFANPAFAEAIDGAIEAALAQGGAQDVTAKLRSGPRRVEFEGAAFLLPTVVRCASLEHPLANTEYLFPFVSVVEVPEREVLDRIGPSLVVTAITRDPDFVARLTASPDIHRLNLGPVATSRVEWDQPHEGNLFEFLYARRALQRASDW